MGVNDYFSDKELECLKNCGDCEIADSCDIRQGMSEFLGVSDSE
jgi:hypothetical protein